MRQQGGYATGGQMVIIRDDSFFNPFYVGFLVGVSSVKTRTQFLKPGIEFSFYPDFINNSNNTMGSYSRRSSIGMAVVSVVFGIGK
jgi:hypothetical protein